MKSLTISINLGSDSSPSSKDVLFWNAEDNSKGQMISNYLEKYKVEIRHTYLRFIDELANKKIDNNTITKAFSLDNHHNLWKTSLINEKCPIKSPHIVDCLKLICLEKILIQKKIKLINLYSQNNEITKSIELLCLRKKIKLIQHRKISFNRIFHFIKLPLSLRAFIYILRIGINYVNFFGTNNHLKKYTNKISIFSYLLNFEVKANSKEKILFHSSYWNKLPEMIRKNFRGINWFHIPIGFQTKNYSKIENLNHLKLKDKHELISNSFSFKLFIKSTLIFLKYLFKKYDFNKKFSCFNLKNSNINFWYLLEEDWNKSFKGSNLFYSIMMMNIFDNILSNIPKQKVGIYLLENQAWEKSLISSWNKFNHGGLIGVAHSTIRFWDLRYFRSKKYLENKILLKNEFPNHIAVNGMLSMNALLKGGYNRELLIKTEALRFLYLNKYKTNKYKRKKIKKILLIGDIDKNNTMDLLSSINTIQSKIIGHNITFRSHPGQVLKNEANQLGINNSNEKELVKDINRNDLIVISGSSSVALEVLILNKPLVVFFSNDKLNLSPLSDFKEIHFVSTPKNLLESIIRSKHNKKLIKKNSLYLDKELTYWKANLEKIFHEK
tara:strand:- start:639 stop:2468 length:1830 start_codon:yes stop_codon:yes gene_type:complete